MTDRTRLTPLLALTIALAALPGCGGAVDTTYGRSRDTSINGTGVLANLFRDRGHTVRTAVRLTDELADWADVIVRFAPYPGPPQRTEADWYLDWLTGIGERRLIYVPRDFDSAGDYWSAVLERLPKGREDLRKRAETLRDLGKGRPSKAPTRPKETGTPDDWFAVKANTSAPQVCKALDGPWGRGIDPAKAALTRHETIVVQSETVLLRGDGEPLVVEWTLLDESRVLVAANASFLLNAALVNPARRPLALRVVQWAGEEPLHVAFVEGGYVLDGPPAQPSVFALLAIPPFGQVTAQLFALGLAACLARAPRLGRPRHEPPTGEDRPAAHPEALGSLLARGGNASEALAILEAYRRWRSPSQQFRVGPRPLAGATGPSSQSESPENE